MALFRNILLLMSILPLLSQAQTFTSVVSSDKNITFTMKGITFEMVYVKGGSFIMGCMSEYSDNCNLEEKPSHNVKLSDFYIGMFQVTQGLWQAVMGDNPSIWKGENLPVERVSWNDCQTFISRLNNLSGKQFRLPTEAQWEFAARGGNKSKGFIYSGSNDPDKVAWYKNNSLSITHEVGSKLPNELGIFDMTGNVWEWCNDLYNGNYYAISPIESPEGALSGLFRVVRGGSWYTTTEFSRLTVRDSDRPDYRDIYVGLRLALND